MEEYIEKMANNQWVFQSFSDCCPLCYGKNCAVFIGTYERKKIVFMFVVYTNVPIQRGECRRLGPNPSAHRTFSLLLQPFIPYQQSTLDVILEASAYNKNHSYEQTKNYIQQDKDISLEHSQLNNFDNIFKQAFIKINSIRQLKDKMNQTIKNYADPIQAVIDFISVYQSPLDSTNQLTLTPIEKLSLDFFYYYQTQPYFQRQFLFGTPSQKR